MGGFSESRKLSRSRVNPAGQVGKQIEGRSGWRASAASGGIAGGFTGSGDKGAELVAQLASSTVSTASVIRSASGAGLGFLDCIVLLLLAAGFLGPCCGFCALGGLGSGCAFLCALGLQARELHAVDVLLPPGALQRAEGEQRRAQHR